MTHSNWRLAFFAMLAGLVLGTHINAQSNSGGTSAQGNAQTNSQSTAAQSNTQGTSNDSSSQGTNQNDQQNQKQASSNNANTANTQQQGNTQQSNSNNQNASAANSSQAPANQKNQTATNTDSQANQNPSGRADGQDQRSLLSPQNKDRSDNQNGQYNQRDADNRSPRTDSRNPRDNMRGPDIGLWFNRSSRDGLVVSDVATKGAIAKLGFREGDRIVSVNGRRVVREDEFMQSLFNGNAARVTVIVLRDGREQQIAVEPAVFTNQNEYVEVDPLEKFGIVVDDRYDDRIVVWRVVPRSPAYYGGFRSGDVITTFGGRPYRTRTEFETGARDWKPGDVDVQVRRGERTRDLSVNLPILGRTGVRTAVRNDRGTDQPSTERNNTRRPGIFGRER